MNTKNFFTKKRFSAAFVLLMVILSITITAFITTRDYSPAPAIGELYLAAVIDALIIEPDEVYPLVSLAQNDPFTTWNDAGQVLLVTWNNTPELYQNGEIAAIGEYEVWAFTDREITEWYRLNKKNVTDWELRFKQLIGLPPDTGYTHFTAMWVDTGNVLRPAYRQDVTVSNMTTGFYDDADEVFLEWFNGNKLYSYFEKLYPWTRLGYTYDWAEGGTEYGLSEFIILPNSTVLVEFTVTTEDFLHWLESQAEGDSYTY